MIHHPQYFLESTSISAIWNSLRILPGPGGNVQRSMGDKSTPQAVGSNVFSENSPYNVSNT